VAIDYMTGLGTEIVCRDEIRLLEDTDGDYKVRLCHSFFGADHGYPYLYYEHPREALPPLADLGLGSSAGGVCYLETAFAPDYRGNLFWCEWGRAVMRARPRVTGSGFAPLQEIEFAAGAANDPYGFKPTDLVVGHDGGLFVSDWADGQRPKRGRGRIYRITPPQPAPAARPVPAKGGPDALLEQLDSPSYRRRVAAQESLQRLGKDGLSLVREALRKKRLGTNGKLHAVWILAGPGGKVGSTHPRELLAMAKSDSEARVRTQAIRALGDLADPVLTQHRLDAGPGSANLADQLAALNTGGDPCVLREIVIALGRLQWSEAPDWLSKNLPKDADAALSHAAQQALRRSRNWPALVKLLDLPDSEPIRDLALRALAGQYQPTIVDGLMERLAREASPSRRRAYADLQTRVHRKPGPWVYWGYRPPPRPAPTVPWGRTDAIAGALERLLADADFSVRRDLLLRMQRENIPVRLTALVSWLRADRDPGRVALLLETLKKHSAKDTRAPLTDVARDSRQARGNRLAALATLAGGLDSENESTLLRLAESVEDGEVLAAVLDRLGQRPRLQSGPLLLKKTASADPAVRAAALEALSVLGNPEAGARVHKLLKDNDVRVRRAAASAAGKLNLSQETDALLQLARDPSPAVRQACLESLRLLRSPGAVPLAVAALEHPETRGAALRYLEALAGPDQGKAVADLAMRHPVSDNLVPVARMLTHWGQTNPSRRVEMDRLLAEVQGVSGSLERWRMTGPLSNDNVLPLLQSFADAAKDPPAGMAAILAAGPEARLVIKKDKTATGGRVWLGYSDVILRETALVQFLAASNGSLRIWVDGRLMFQRKQARPFQPDADRFETQLTGGSHRLWVELGPPDAKAGGGDSVFQVRFRRKSSSLEQEKLAQRALSQTGNIERGRKVFFDRDKSLCLKCHRLGGQGESIGPELTGIGKRFSRIYIIESILEPSRSIGPGFQAVFVELKNGRTMTGLPVAETGTTLTLADPEGKKHEIARSDIETRRTLSQSIMPDGFERRLTPEEFVDLIAFLAGQK
jgi:putative heme-binding domain-containing protein